MTTVVQFIRRKSIVNSLINSDSQSVCKILLPENVFNSLEIFIGLEDPVLWGIRRAPEAEEGGILTLNFRVLHLHFIWFGTENIFIFTSIRSNT